jgi:hypothetical protein
MTEPHELPWNPLTPSEVIDLFASWDRFWCIAGGWAIDLNTRQVSREHEDVDVLVLRRDLDALHAQLPGWELWVAWPPGRLSPWPPGETIHEEAHDIWCREARMKRWRFQLMVMDHDEDNWIFRRNWTAGGPLASLAREVDGVPLLAPEIQLLYKGNGIRRPKDEADFLTALPHLSPDQRVWLRDALASREPDHPWLPLLATDAPDTA